MGGRRQKQGRAQNSTNPSVGDHPKAWPDIKMSHCPGTRQFMGSEVSCGRGWLNSPIGHSKAESGAGLFETRVPRAGRLGMLWVAWVKPLLGAGVVSGWKTADSPPRQRWI